MATEVKYNSSLVKPTAEVVARSRSNLGIDIVTWKLRLWRPIHTELMTHRVFSRNASSSRALPAGRLREEAANDNLRTGPVIWAAEQKGMQVGELLRGTGLRNAEEYWRGAATSAVSWSNTLSDGAVHKSICNRVLEPYTSINVLLTTTDVKNFFGLRLHKDAEPTMRALAVAMWNSLVDVEPSIMLPGDWHLPFVDEETVRQCIGASGLMGISPSELAIRVSVARCARTSYLSFVTGRKSTVVEDVELYDKLVGSSPIHASPAEHQATPDDWLINREEFANPHEHGNLHGWRQYRKTLPGESEAPLPDGYDLKDILWSSGR